MAARVRLLGLGDRAGRNIPAERLLGQSLGIDLAGVRVLLSSFPTELPIEQDGFQAQTLASELAELGLDCCAIEVPEGERVSCSQHERLVGASYCAGCRASLCVICDRRGRGSCENCITGLARKKKWKTIRVAFLLCVLFFVVLLAWKESRRKNLGWETPQRVAVVLVVPSGAEISDELAQAFRHNTQVVEAALQAARRVHEGAAGPPVGLTVLGPIAEVQHPPKHPQEGTLALLRFNWELESYASDQDQAAGLDEALYDARIYLRIKESSGHHEAAEGLGQQGGTIGVVSTEISEEGVDFAWFVALHEFFHTRGASDKYDAEGFALVPEGLADPERRPLLPQSGTELMARGRPVIPGKEDIPGTPDTWVVGVWTAREIGWLPSTSPE